LGHRPGVSGDLVAFDPAGHPRRQVAADVLRRDLLEKLDRHAEATAEFRRAGELATNAAECNLSLERAQATAARA